MRVQNHRINFRKFRIWQFWRFPNNHIMKSIKNMSFCRHDISITIYPNIIIRILGVHMGPFNTFLCPTCSCGKQTNYDIPPKPPHSLRYAKTSKNDQNSPESGARAICQKCARGASEYHFITTLSVSNQ